jgi:hypothetical protein
MLPPSRLKRRRAEGESPEPTAETEPASAKPATSVLCPLQFITRRHYGSLLRFTFKQTKDIVDALWKPGEKLGTIKTDSVFSF